MGASRDKVLAAVQDRIVNATCLAEVIYKAACTGNIDVSVAGSACEILYDYLDDTWDMANKSSGR